MITTVATTLTRSIEVIGMKTSVLPDWWWTSPGRCPNQEKSEGKKRRSTPRASSPAPIAIRMSLVRTSQSG